MNTPIFDQIATEQGFPFRTGGTIIVRDVPPEYIVGRGVMAFESSTHTMRVGDGWHRWSELVVQSLVDLEVK